MLGLLLFYCICTFLVIRFFIFILRYVLKRYQISSFPQVPSLFLIGEPRFFTHSPLNFWLVRILHEMSDNFVREDKLFVAWLTIIPIFVTFNKNYIKEILSKNEVEYLSKGSFLYPGIEEAAPNGLFTIEGSKWKIRRKLLSQPFHPANMGNFLKIVDFESKKLVDHLKKNECKDLLRETKKISLYIYFKLLFEYDLVNEIDYAVELSDQVLNLYARKALSVFIVSPFIYNFTKLANEENIMLNKLMVLKNKILDAKVNLKEDLKQKLESTDQELLGKPKNLSVIEILLMNFKDQIDKKTSGGWSGFERKEITAQMDTLIVAGVDTQSSALCFLLYDLAQHPQWQERIYEEIQQVCCNNNKNDSSTPEVTLEQVKQMPLLEAFVQESLRLKPVIQAIIRNITKEIKLDEKYTIPANTDVAIFIEKVLKDPDYFPNPLEFKPERFLGDQKDSLYTNIPFSAGPRNCIAKKVALQVQSIVTANLLKNLRIETTPSTPDELITTFDVVNRPIDKIELKFVPRN